MNFIYSERESKILEFKSTLPKWLTLIKTCVAFANMAGGQIIIGIEDGSQKILGITDEIRDRIYDEFPNSLYDTTSPNLFAHIYERNVSGKSILIIEIPSGTKKPYYIKSEGIPHGVYIRVGTSTRRANQEVISELMRETQRITYDEETVPGNPEILSPDLLKEYYGGRYDLKKLQADKIIVPTINPEKYQATVAGVLFFTEEPQQYIHEAVILCTQFLGVKGRNIVQTRELTGPLPQLAESSLILVSAWLERNFRLQGTILKPKLPIPKEALREAILNALIHRKYSIPGAIKIAIYDDRCEIFNPGGFPGLLNINQLGDGTTYLRNPIIARLARKIGLVEKLGTGIRLILDSCKKMGIRHPQYVEDGDFVKVIFYFAPDKFTTESNNKYLVDYIKQKGSITIQETIKLLDVSRNTATRKLNQLVNKKQIARIGKGPSVKFIST